METICVTVVKVSDSLVEIVMSFIPIADNRIKDMNPRYSESDFNRNALYCRPSESQRSIRCAHISYPKPNPSKQMRSTSNRNTDSSYSKPVHSREKCHNSYVNSSLLHSKQNTSNYLNPRNSCDKGFKSENKSSVNMSDSKAVNASKHMEHIWSGLPLSVWESLMTSQSSTVALCGRESSSDTSSAEVLSSLHSSSQFDSSSSEEDVFLFTGLSNMTSFQPLSLKIVNK